MIRSRRRLALGTALLATAALTLSACGTSGPGESAAGEASAWATTGSVHEQIWKTSFENWNSEHPDAEISVEWFNNDAYKEKIRTAIGAGTGPSLVFGWGGGTLADYVDQGKVVDLTGKVSNLVDRVLPSVVKNGMIGDKLYAVPNSQSQPVVLYYNTELFDEVGVDVPKTWNELLSAVDAFVDAGVTPFALAGASKWPELMWIQYLTDRIGGSEVFDAVLAGEEDAWSDPAIIEALEKIQELVDRGAFGDGFGSVVADTRADAALLHTGKAAMLLQGSWLYSSFLTDAPDFVERGRLATTSFPTIEGGAGDPANIVGNPANYWSVSADASEDVQDTVTSYLDEMVFSDDYTTQLIEGGGVPPVAGLEEELAKSDNADFLTFAYDLVKNAPHFQLSWDQALRPSQAQELLTNLDLVFLKKSTPQQFVDAMNGTL
ncbi:extracellular solute-binding protein [Paramicrobacterium agarici]|uniref:extracellular solute-binding protein n=1 Tax=Paramicrobacterium agarici TaxID=630514 RepID=UPI00115121B8|nr:extracellular solute-binding protein [Microbacterium agarici]TQO23547.1 carbohydrate ABC transporter substrate-binding protein (CUT1 family) [Microbacterium agarici]